MDKAATIYLIREHEIIQSVLSFVEVLTRQHESKKSISWDAMSDLLDFFSSYADKIHHAKEEDILFPYLHDKGILMGGPHCSYYTGVRFIRQSPTQIISELNQEMGLKNDAGKPATSDGNPLNPIVEEHALGRKLVERLRFDLGKVGDTQTQNSFFYYLNLYKSMLEEHIQKENTCLFYMVDYYFNDQIQADIADKFRQVDEVKMKPEIERCKAIVARLSQLFVL